MADGARMTGPDDIARRRFHIIAVVKAAGLVLMIAGIVIMAGSVVRQGGATEIGAPIGVIGAALSLLGPRILARRWRTPPGGDA